MRECADREPIGAPLRCGNRGRRGPRVAEAVREPRLLRAGEDDLQRGIGGLRRDAVAGSPEQHDLARLAGIAERAHGAAHAEVDRTGAFLSLHRHRVLAQRHCRGCQLRRPQPHVVVAHLVGEIVEVVAVVDAEDGVLPGVLRHGQLDDLAQGADVVPAVVEVAGLGEMNRLGGVAVGFDDRGEAPHRGDTVAVVEVARIWVETELVGEFLQPELVELLQIALLVRRDAAEHGRDNLCPGRHLPDGLVGRLEEGVDVLLGLVVAVGFVDDLDARHVRPRVLEKRLDVGAELAGVLADRRTVDLVGDVDVGARGLLGVALRGLDQFRARLLMDAVAQQPEAESVVGLDLAVEPLAHERVALEARKN